MGVISLLVLLVAALMVLSAIDRARYNSYRARFLWGGLPTLCVPAYPLLAWSGIRLVPAPLAPSSAATARRSERAQRTR